LFKQCDPRWGNDMMGIDGPGHRATVCREGCAMSSLSMALNGLGIKISGASADPGSFNKWLLANAGYLCLGGDCDNLVLDAVERLTPKLKFISEVEKQSVAVIEQGITSGEFVYIAHVHNKGHFVILTGLTADHKGFQVNDPFYNTTIYPYANISDIILYQVVAGAEEISVESPVIPRNYPLYKQCNSSWANNVMTHKTICQVGCLMSSTAMALYGYGIKTPDGAAVNPATFNTWLKAHGGYVGDGLAEGVVPKMSPGRIVWPSDGMHTKNDLSIDTVRSYLQKGRVMIANVNHGGHFVLGIGYDNAAGKETTLLVHDPGFDRTSYDLKTDVMGWRIFDLK